MQSALSPDSHRERLANAVQTPQPADAVRYAWNTMTESAVCDPPVLPSAPARVAEPRRNATGARGQWFEEGAGQEMFESSPCGILLTSPRGWIIDANPAFLAITGESWAAVAGNRVHVALGLPALSDVLPNTPMQRGGAVQIERTCRHRSGRKLEFELTIVPVPGTVGATDVLAIHVVDITSQRAAERDAEELADLLHGAHHDYLTGLKNRRAVSEADHEGAPTTVVFADLDMFKAINDVYGHGVGDEVLVAVGARITTMAAGDGMAVRWGGDEFLLVLDGHHHNIKLLNRRLRASVEQPIQTSVGEITIGVSLGAVQSENESLFTAIERADEASYADKRDRGEDDQHEASLCLQRQVAN